MKEWRALIPVIALGLAGCGDSDSPSGDHVVARAAGVELTAETVAEILAPQLELQNQPGVVEAVADLWIQYFLLAQAASEDTTLTNIDVSTVASAATCDQNGTGNGGCGCSGAPIGLTTLAALGLLLRRRRR